MGHERGVHFFWCIPFRAMWRNGQGTWVMRILLVGGAGYIGSSIACHLLDKGHEPGIFDNFSTGKREAVPAGAFCREGDCGDSEALASALNDFGATAVIQLAASVRVEESVSDPWKYYFNNTTKSLTPDELYAVSAYILNLNGLIGAGDVIDAQSLPKVKMPNRDGFIPFPRQWK